MKGKTFQGDSVMISDYFGINGHSNPSLGLSRIERLLRNLYVSFNL